jgi:hypothetical protein
MSSDRSASLVSFARKPIAKAPALLGIFPDTQPPGFVTSILTVTASAAAETFLTAVWMNTFERPVATDGTTADVTLVAANDDGTKNPPSSSRS